MSKIMGGFWPPRTNAKRKRRRRYEKAPIRMPSLPKVGQKVVWKNGHIVSVSPPLSASETAAEVGGFNRFIFTHDRYLSSFSYLDRVRSLPDFSKMQLPVTRWRGQRIQPIGMCHHE